MTTTEAVPAPQLYLDESDWPSVDHLITEDDTPVDNPFSEKQQRLLTEPLYSSWKPQDGRSFVACANVGVFPVPKNPAIVPDMFLSLDVQLPADLWKKQHRAYMVWEYGKPPDVVVEVVSNKEGNENSDKYATYARIGVDYYVIFDPLKMIMSEVLTCYELRGGRYVSCACDWLSTIGLGVRLWEGSYEGSQAVWLRWCEQDGKVISTGAEQAAEERQRAERLAAQLRALGIEPEV